MITPFLRVEMMEMIRNCFFNGGTDCISPTEESPANS